MVGTFIKSKGQDIVPAEPVCDRGIDIVERIRSAYFLTITVLSVLDRDYGSEHRIEPASSDRHIERCPAFDNRAFKLKTSIYQPYHKCPRISVRITVTGSHIHHRTQSASVPCRKAALVEIQMIHDIGIEG